MHDRQRETSMFPDRESLTTISFAQRMVASDAFKGLFKEGMTLVEETAAYLDGPGRDESRALNRQNALAYASESMRLTTRLMQLTSWLLLQRAVNEGELSREDAEREHSRVKVSAQDIASAPDMFVLLPIALRTMVERSLRLQERILRIDGDLKAEANPATAPAGNPVGNQLGMLQQAFALRQN